MGQARQSESTVRVAGLKAAWHRVSNVQGAVRAKQKLLDNLIRDQQALINDAVLRQTSENTRALEQLCDELNGKLQVANDQTNIAQSQRDNTLAHVADLRHRLDKARVSAQNANQALADSKRKVSSLRGWFWALIAAIVTSAVCQALTGLTPEAWVRSLF